MQAPRKNTQEAPSSSQEPPRKKKKTWSNDKYCLLDLDSHQVQDLLAESEDETVGDSDEEDEEEDGFQPLEERPGSPGNVSHEPALFVPEPGPNVPLQVPEPYLLSDPHDPNPYPLFPQSETPSPLFPRSPAPENLSPPRPQPLSPQSPIQNPPSPPRPNLAPAWSNDPPQNRPNIPFTGRSGLKIFPETQTPSGYFDLLFSDSFLGDIVRETNSFAQEIFRRGHSPRSRITAWKELTIEEFKKFLGVFFMMGMIKINRINAYWDTTYLFDLPFFRGQMSRDRFLAILQCLHFAANPQEGEPAPEDPLYKVRLVATQFYDRMLEIHEPGKNVSIDESMAAWRGRVFFRSYLPNKAHKYGIKLYILAEDDGLIHRFLIYAGARDREVAGEGHASKVVHKLMDGLTDSGRSLYMDNYYNSVGLTRDLLGKKTYVTGTLRANRKGNPSEVVQKNVSKGEVVQQWSDDGINVAKWRDKRPVLTISSEFSGDLVDTTTGRGVQKQKPIVVCLYNKHMGGTDRADQLLSYFLGTRKSLKWYKKLGFHIMELMLLNSYLLFKRYRVSNEKMDLWAYRLEVIKYLCPQDPSPTPSARHPSTKLLNYDHIPDYLPRDGKNRIKQKKCRICYENKKTKSVTTFCPGCPGEPGLCIPTCFKMYHSKNGYESIQYN